jgi:hypothetical protein
LLKDVTCIARRLQMVFTFVGSCIACTNYYFFFITIFLS